MLGGYADALPKPSTKAKDGSPAYTGKQLFSLFLPSDFNYTLTSKWSKGTGGKANDVVIKNGELIGGVIDKTSIGAEEPELSLIHISEPTRPY